MSSSFDKSIIPFEPGWHNIVRPTLLVDETRVRRNLERMMARAARSETILRPHFKTHQMARVGEWCREAGIERITVSSLQMARYFAAHGWRDITIAFPVNIRELPQINKLAGKIRLNLLVESAEVVTRLAESLTHPVGTWIKIDAGYGRTGQRVDAVDDILAIAKSVAGSDTLELEGLLAHSGHTYQATSPDAVRALHYESLASLSRLQRTVAEAMGCHILLSMGDTPTCSVLEAFDEVDEMRPGNFLFYDVMQWQNNVCSENDIAVAVACPIVAVHEDRQEVVIYGGAVHLSKEVLLEEGGVPGYGRIAMLEEDGWGNCLVEARVSKISQEHGILKGKIALINEDMIGRLVAIIPNHSCLAADALHEVCFFSGK